MADYCCGNCERLETNGRTYYGNEYYCAKDGKTHKLTSKACAAIVKNKAIRDKEAKEWHPCGWKFYIVTVICKIITHLYGSDLTMGEKLSKIRSEYLEKSPEYRSTLEDYDLFGPEIAAIIDEQEDKNKIAQFLTNNYLIPAVRCINDDNYEEATRIYFRMVDMLKTEYSLVSTVIDSKMEDELANYEYNLIRPIN